MESHPKCTFCFTNGYRRYGDKIIKKKIIPWDYTTVIKKGQYDFNVGELVLIDHIPTASAFYPNNFYFPDVLEGAFQGDVYTSSVMTNYGYAHFIDEPTCIYRRNVATSLTTFWEKHLSAHIEHINSMLLLYESLKEITNHKYDNIFNMLICRNKIEKFYRLNDKEGLQKIKKSGELKYLKYGNLTTFVILILKCYFPELFAKTRKFLKEKIKRLNQ